MEEIVIRHGCVEGPRNPSLADVERAMADIEASRDQRPEFSIEYVSSWKRKVIDGREVVTTMPGCHSLPVCPADYAAVELRFSED